MKAEVAGAGGDSLQHIVQYVLTVGQRSAQDHSKIKCPKGICGHWLETIEGVQKLWISDYWRNFGGAWALISGCEQWYLFHLSLACFLLVCLFVFLFFSL